MSKPEIYPRSAPYRRPDGTAPAPAAPVAPASGMRQSLLMVGFCGLFLVAGLGIGLFAIGRTNRADAAPDDKVQHTDGARKPGGLTAPPVDDSLRLAGASSDPDSLPPVPPSSGKDSSAPRLQVPEQQPGLPLQGGKVTSQPGKPTAIPEAVVEALGGLTASHLYQTYLNVGLLADSVEGEVYEKDEARKLLDTVSGLMGEVERQLDRIGRQSLKDEEKKAVEQARSVMANLRTQVRELQNYWENGEKDHVTKFHQARKDAWSGIKDLLNIQE